MEGGKERNWKGKTYEKRTVNRESRKKRENKRTKEPREGRERGNGQINPNKANADLTAMH